MWITPLWPKWSYDNTFFHGLCQEPGVTAGPSLVEGVAIFVMSTQTPVAVAVSTESPLSATSSKQRRRSNERLLVISDPVNNRRDKCEVHDHNSSDPDQATFGKTAQNPVISRASSFSEKQISRRLNSRPPDGKSIHHLRSGTSQESR